MSTANPARRHTVALSLAGLALGAGIAALGYVGHEGGAMGWLMAARYTARLSFALFLIVFLVSPMARAFGGDTLRSALRERRGLGLGFAAAHYVHLAALTGALIAFREAPAMPTLVFGGLAYVLMTAMVATSNDAAVRRLGPANWKRLHTFGLYYIWFIFAVTYLRRVMRSPEMTEYWVLLAIALAALAFRLTATRRRALA